MKKSTDIVNLPVFSISEGKEVGHVSSLLINAEKGTVDYMIVKTASLEFGIKAVPFEKIEGIGDYAVTIENEGVIVELSNVPSAHEMLTKNVQLIGSKIISKKGSLLGQVGEYYLDNISGKILGSMLMISDKTSVDQIVLAEHVVTYGKEVVIVQEDILEKLVSYQTFIDKVADSEKKHDGTVVMSTAQATVTVPEHTLHAGADFVAVTTEVKTAIAEEKVTNIVDNVTNIYEATIAKEEFDARRQLEDRHILFMMGKRLTKDFFGENGEVLIPKDTLLTEELILRVKALGSSKLLELSMSVGE